MQRYRTTGWSYDISEKEEMAEVICLVQLCWHYRENVSVIKPATGRVSAAVLQLTAHETVGLYSAAPQGQGDTEAGSRPLLANAHSPLSIG